MRLSLLPLGLGLALATGSGSEAREPREGPPRKAGDVVIEAASLTAGGGSEVRFELGTLYVPENRAEPDSRLIGVGFARFKAEPPSDAPPIFLLPGGPGSSYLSDLKPGRLRPGLVDHIARFRAVGDIVLA